MLCATPCTPCLFSPYVCAAHRPRGSWCASCQRRLLFPEYTPPVCSVVPVAPAFAPYACAVPSLPVACATPMFAPYAVAPPPQPAVATYPTCGITRPHLNS